MTSQKKTLDEYVGDVVRFSGKAPEGTLRETMLSRFRKAFSLLPSGVADLFLSHSRHLAITVMPDMDFPFGMSTRTEGQTGSRQYTITVYHEHGDWPEARFIGAFLRELGHVVAQRPPEEEWPVARAERAKFKEQLENRADAMVWRWGLRHYNMTYITATFPEHWVEPILAGIGKSLQEESEYDA
jgi:hypothetical protein